MKYLEKRVRQARRGCYWYGHQFYIVSEDPIQFRCYSCGAFDDGENTDELERAAELEGEGEESVCCLGYPDACDCEILAEDEGEGVKA